MASQKDVQDLLRLLTTGRNKISIMAAMGRVKALQAANIRSVADIASSDLPAIKTAISDEKAAKSLLAAAKAYVKSGSSTSGTKRPADSSLSSPSKKFKSAYELSSEPQSPAELEASLSLPQPSTDEEAISKCTIHTNRAPLVLAFAVELLKYTMPEQPLSSRLSLAQAVVSVNSRSKAVSIGLEKGKGADEEGWGKGQPKVKIMLREITVLKRSGYEWRSLMEEANIKEEPESSASTKTQEEKDFSVSQGGGSNGDAKGWSTSAPITSKSSRFVAHAIEISTSSEASTALSRLLASNPELREASHNITAYRIQTDKGLVESCEDDGESGGGRHLLGLLQADNNTNVFLLVTRWYGGIMLGPDRWRIMTEVSRDALSQRLRVAGIVGQEALWGLDLEAMRATNSPANWGTVAKMPIHKPDGARAYILKSFNSVEPASTEDTKKKKKSGAALDREREDNLGLLLGALDLLFASWVEHISRDELDRRAWGWYVQVRPEVEQGVAGWGGKGQVKLADILNMRRKG